MHLGRQDNDKITGRRDGIQSTCQKEFLLKSSLQFNKYEGKKVVACYI